MFVWIHILPNERKKKKIGSMVGKKTQTPRKFVCALLSAMKLLISFSSFVSI